MRIFNVLAISTAIVLTGCAGASSIRMSEREILVKSEAAPICGGIGAMKVAQKQAAIETIKAGYDRYVVVGASSSNNVRTHVTQGSSYTYGSANVYGNNATFNANTTYTPMVITSGTHDQSFAIRMYREREAGASQAINARSVLGPKWEEAVKKNILTCAD